MSVYIGFPETFLSLRRGHFVPSAERRFLGSTTSPSSATLGCVENAGNAVSASGFAIRWSRSLRLLCSLLLRLDTPSQQLLASGCYGKRFSLCCSGPIWKNRFCLTS